MNTPDDLQPAVVVTGASSGIGRELARVAAADGAFVVLVARSADKLAELAAELIAVGGKAFALAADLADPSAGDRIEKALAEQRLYCDVIVNNAAYGLFGRAAEIGRDKQLQLLDVNMRALTDLTLRFLPGMIARRRGGVLNVGSVTGYTIGPYMAAYYASKAYVRSFTAALAGETAGTGVRVTCLSPGVVRTAFFLESKARQTRLFKMLPRSDARSTAVAGWRGFKAGKRVVIPRWHDRLLAGFCSVMPDAILLRLEERLQRPR